MDEKGMPLCSQSFFVSQRTRTHKLSLTTKSMNKSKDSSTSRSKRSSRMQGSARGRPSSALHSRCGGKASNFATVDRYFVGTKDSGSCHISLEREKDEPSNTGDQCRSSDTICILQHSTAEDDEFKAERDPTSCETGGISCKSVGMEHSESVVEASPPGRTSLQDYESNASKDGERSLILQETDKANILMCPICWKSFDNKDTHTAHMKLCAVKHKMTTKQLLDALELVQRQEAERQSLGLPLLANKISRKPKKELTGPCIKPKTASDGSLQLGLALSASLIEAEREKERNHLLEAGLIEEANEKGLLPTQEMSESIPAKPAPIFLNIGRKTGDETKDTFKGRRRNVKYGFGGRVPTILKRTVEERERLITEKVAVILVGDDTGISRKRDSFDGQKSAWEIRSKEIEKFINKENAWWTLAGLSPTSVSQKQYYVDSLSEFISPSKVVAGAKLKHLSQIPGRNNTPDKSSTSQVDKKERDLVKLYSPTEINFSELRRNVQPSSKKPSVKRNLFYENHKLPTQNSLSKDWSHLIGKKEMSDITIFTQEEREIPAHKLVFYVRCPSVLKDLVEERRGNMSSNMLIWNETCYSAVMVLLKFIYSGEISEVSSLEDHVVNDLKQISNRYHLRELESFLDTAIISSGSPGVDFHNEISTYNNKTDLQTIKHGKYAQSKSEGEDICYQIVSPNTEMHEKSLLLNPDDKGITSESLVVKSPSIRINEEKNNHDEVFGQNSPSPPASVLAFSSPDIFQGSGVDSPESPKSIMVVDDVQTVNETCGDSDLSQSSRSSIDYLVSLMEKESESSGINVESQSGEGASIVLDRILDHSNITKTSKPSFENVDFTDENECRTPSLVDRTNEIIVYPTPAPKEKLTTRGSDEHLKWKENDSIKDSKRKLVTSNDSDSSTPTPKKICLVGHGEDSVAVNSTSMPDREVVDLTLSSPEGDKARETVPLNCSNVSTIPPPPVEEPLVLEEEKENSNDSIPDNSYISNIWDGFEHISDGGYHVPVGLSLDPESDSVKSIPVKGDEEVALSASVIMDAGQKSSPERNCDVLDEGSRDSSKVSVDSNASLRKDKREEENVDIADDDEIIVPSNDIDGCDLTEKLLNASLCKLNDSIFWRDENEPMEGNKGNKNSPSTPQTPLEGRSKVIVSSKATPVNSSGSKFIKSTNVTPIADFSGMKTPMLHRELDRYGIKHLKRNQAKKILRHIYNELHPVVSSPTECNPKASDNNKGNQADVQPSCEKHNNIQPNKDKGIEKSFDLSSDEDSASDDSSDSSSDSVIFEESMCEQMESPAKDMTLSQKACSVDLPTGMRILIERNPDLHRKILLYEPLWLNEIKLALKEVGAKFNVNQLMDFLDEKCITFRLAQGNRHRRKRAPKGKSIALSQPCNSRSKGCGPLSSSQPC